MTKTLKILVITLLAYGTHYSLDHLYFKTFRTWLDSVIEQIGISHSITYLIFGIPLFLGILLIHKHKNFFSSLGLDKSIVKGALFALLCTLPMLVGYTFVFDFNTEITLNNLLITAVAAAFFEELYFRGFLFGQLYRFTKLGFIPSIIIGALLFAMVHLYQSQELMTLVGIFVATFLGAILFAWTYVEWNNNLWAPIFLHFFMNLFWDLFSAGDNALGGLYSNIFRVITIVLIIGLTIFYKKKKGLKFEVNRKTIWMKSS